MLEHPLEQDLAELLLHLSPISFNSRVEFEPVWHIPNRNDIELFHLIVHRMDLAVVEE